MEMNPSASAEIPLVSEFNGPHEWEEKVRENFSMCLRSIAGRVTWKGEDGRFIYFVPGTITFKVERDNMNFQMVLVCEEAVKSGKD